MKIEQSFKTKFVSICLAVIVLCGVALSGCFFGNRVTSVEFNDKVITLSVGESMTIDLSRITITPQLADNKDFTLKSSDSSIFEVSGKKITGKRHGTASLSLTTVSNKKTAYCTVTVIESEPREVKIVADGELTQNENSLSNINFHASFGYISAPGRDVEWTAVDSSGGNLITNDSGQVISSLKQQAKDLFSFMPKASGKYTIGVKTQTSNGDAYTDSVNVNVYKPYVANPVFLHTGGELTQESNSYGKVEFATEYTDYAGNPDRVIEWLVNGEVMGKNSKEFTLNVTKAGFYKVELYINGELIGDSTVMAKGSIVPTNLRFDYDNCYPEVWLYYDVPDFTSELDFQVEVRDKSGKLMHNIDISTLHGTTKNCFVGNSVNLTEFIGKDTANNIFNKEFSIRVKSLGDGVNFVESAYSEALITESVSINGRDYLEKKYFGTSASNGHKNYYIANEDEFLDILGYLFMWRDNPFLGKKEYDESSKKMYMAFKINDDAELLHLITSSYQKLHITGIMGADFEISRNILSLNLRSYTDSLPTKKSGRASDQYPGGLHATRPHINYDSTMRSSLPIEKRTKLINVTTSEQLYYVASLGYRPIPVTGTQADNIYKAAYSVLTNIITQDMSDVDKAHAIYDWIMWKVSYDYEASSNATEINEAVKYNSYYLEGVFSEGNSFAVCDGIAKAYALMCNMENIPCIRVAGMAGADFHSAPWGGHAWNKVFVEGNWYIVDATWGDEPMEFRNFSHYPKYHEMAFHRYFLLTDKELERSHAENTPNNYPRTAEVPFNYYNQKIEYDGGQVDFYINATPEEAATEAQKLVDYLLYLRYSGLPQYKREYFIGGVKTMQNQAICDYIAFDIKISKNIESLFSRSNSQSPLIKAFNLHGYKLGEQFFLLEDSENDGLYMFIFMTVQ